MPELYTFQSEENLGREKLRMFFWRWPFLSKIFKSELGKSTFLTSISGVSVKIVSGVLSFFSVRMILLYLGVEKYGLWVALTSFIALLGFMDFGFGNQLMNNIAKAQGAGCNSATIIRKQIAIACKSLIVIILCFFLMFLASFRFISWQNILATPAHLVHDLYSTLLIVGLSFGITILANLISVIQRGLQKGYYANAWEFGRTISSFLLLYLFIRLHLSMYWIAIALFTLPLCIIFSNWIWFFRKHKEYFPSSWRVKFSEVFSFFKQGSLFFYLQIAAILAYQTDSLILAHYLDYKSVTEYTIGMKLFSIPMILTDTYMASLWPAYAHAYGRKDFRWIKRTFYKSLIGCCLFLFVAALTLILTTPLITNIWLNNKVIISGLFLVILGLWQFLSAFNGNISCLLNALNIARPQAIIVAEVLCLNLVLSIWLVGKIGVAGVLLGTVLSLFIGGLLPYFFLIRRIFKSHLVQTNSIYS